jgi:hypothetical protein
LEIQEILETQDYLAKMVSLASKDHEDLQVQLDPLDKLVYKVL